MLRAGRFFLQFLPQLQQKIVDRARRPVVVHPPHRRLDLLARQHPPARLDQAVEHVKLGRRQLDHRVGAQHLARARPHHHVAEPDLVGRLLDRARLPPQHHLHARQQLGQPERLGHVVLGPQLQAHDLVHLGPARAQHHHRRLVARVARLPQHLEAVHLGQHHVQDDQVKGPPLRQRQAALAVLRHDHLVALGHEVHLQAHRDALVVLDHQDALGRSLTR